VSLMTKKFRLMVVGEPGGIRSEAVRAAISVVPIRSVVVRVAISVVAISPEGANRSLIYVMVKP